VLGKIHFLLVRIKIKHMELAIIRREAAGNLHAHYISCLCVCTCICIRVCFNTYVYVCVCVHERLYNCDCVLVRMEMI
jgi:Vacuolar protein sorting-associated protein 26